MRSPQKPFARPSLRDKPFRPILGVVSVPAVTIVKGKQLLEAIIELAKSKGVVVRKETLKTGHSQGGLCLFKGVPTVFVDERAVVEAQIEMLGAILRRYEWSEEERAVMVPATLAIVTRRSG